MLLEHSLVWVLLYKTQCGPMGFLADAPGCWISIQEFWTRDECEVVKRGPPPGGEFKCEFHFAAPKR
jgi:hypothetical protein